MRFLGLGVPELLIILFVLLLIFGPKNLPKLGNAIGKSFKNLRKGMDENLKEAEEEESNNTSNADEKVVEVKVEDSSKEKN